MTSSEHCIKSSAESSALIDLKWRAFYPGVSHLAGFHNARYTKGNRRSSNVPYEDAFHASGPVEAAPANRALEVPIEPIGNIVPLLIEHDPNNVPTRPSHRIP